MRMRNVDRFAGHVVRSSFSLGVVSIRTSISLAVVEVDSVVLLAKFTRDSSGQQHGQSRLHAIHRVSFHLLVHLKFVLVVYCC